MKNYTLKTIVLNSLEKVFPEIDPTPCKAVSGFSCFNNEPLSFQIAYKLDTDAAAATSVFAKITTDLPISLYSVGYVPVLQSSENDLDDKYRAGLFPDRLLAKKTNPKIELKRYPWAAFHVEDDAVHIAAQSDSWRALWVTVNERKRKLGGGVYSLRIEFFRQNDGMKLGEAETAVTVIDARLPKQKIKYTNWFHCDCICDAHAVEPFTPRFWELFADYVDKASLNGMNTLLTPCFTPPLDTPIGGERRTVQLVGVKVSGGKYSFDFSLLEKYISIARKHGIEYFEHSHFFTQWGAEHAPKIMATVDGKYKRLFGWDTVAWGKKYKSFLHEYIPALLAFLRARKLDKKFIFHVSDEPSPNTHRTYRKAKAALGDLLRDYTVCDALSHYEFYADGTVATPIVKTADIKDFIGRTDHLWAYYTGDECFLGLSNRKLNCSGERNRMLGIQMYMNGIEGFLNWGYNFFYDALSQGFADPNTDACIYCGTNPGAGFIVYPAISGGCIQSIRQKVFYEGINDMRALQLLERYIGKGETKKFVQDFFGEVTLFTHPTTPERLLQFRELLNQKINELIRNKVRCKC